MLEHDYREKMPYRIIEQVLRTGIFTANGKPVDYSEEVEEALAPLRSATEAPHGYEQDTEDLEIKWAVWCGTRRTDERTTAVGYYRHYAAPTDGDPEAMQLEFRPVLDGLSHEEAELLARAFAVEMNGDMNNLRQLAEWVGGDERD